MDEWWQKHYADVYINEEQEAPESPEEDVVPVSDEPLQPFVTFGNGSETLAQIAAPLDDPEVLRRSHHSFQGALNAWEKYSDKFIEYGDEYSVDPLILAAIAGHESGGNADAVGKTQDLGLMQFTERTWARIMPGRPLEERLDPNLSIEAAAKLFSSDRSILKNEDLAVLAYNIGHARVTSVIQGESEFPGRSRFYWPAVALTHERLTQTLNLQQE
jgi:soluble lytic murein transglycosylase-like protein